jgi:PAS domain S-box-containing protein
MRESVMQDRDKTKEQLVQEVKALRQRVGQLEAAEAKFLKTQEDLGQAGVQPHRLFEYAGESIFIIDLATFRFLSVNENAARRLGYSREELLQMTLDQIEVQDAEDMDEAVAWESIVSGTTYYECIHRRKDGSQMPVEVSSRLTHSGGRGLLLHFVRDISRRKELESEREKLVCELQEALAEVRTLSGLLPMCAHCKNIRDDEGYWHSLEDYMLAHSETRFSHGICPDCMADLYPRIKPMEE